MRWVRRVGGGAVQGLRWVRRVAGGAAQAAVGESPAGRFRDCVGKESRRRGGPVGGR